METGYLFVHRETLDREMDGLPRVTPTRLNGTNRVFHRDPTCSGSGRHGGADLVVVSAPIKDGYAILRTGKTPVRECRACASYRSPMDLNDSGWRDAASCIDDEEGLHFSTIEAKKTRARGICFSCPSRLPCLDYAERTRQEFGIWGGLTPEQRGHSRDVVREGNIVLGEYDELRLDLELWEL